ncbi:MAG: CDP-alcohol phosphatidyltransferase family protein [candidate division Zixibacteria bacterium]|nr:CDP-alcohol phosphatidyltransferase family protein [candidate division Zixibacteria bacterium]
MSDQAAGRFLTIPNILSLSRVALLPLWWFLMSAPDRALWWWGGALMAYGILSDAMDGYIARRFNQVTEWGKVFDPVGDKAVVAVIGIFCVTHRGFPLAALVIAFARDLGLIIAGWVAYRRVGHIPMSMNLGRYAALIWGVLLVLYVFDWQPYARVLLWPAMALYLAAGVGYYVKRRQILQLAPRVPRHARLKSD